MTRQLRKMGPEQLAQEDDFCNCDRGVEAHRWFKAGAEAPEALLTAMADCPDCEATTGLRRYAGWEVLDANGYNGSILMLGGWVPRLSARAMVDEAYGGGAR